MLTRSTHNAFGRLAGRTIEGLPSRCLRLATSGCLWVDLVSITAPLRAMRRGTKEG
jgi:hypothetical protein